MSFLENISLSTIIIVALIAFLVNLGGLAWIILNQIALEYEIKSNRIFFEGKIEVIVKTLAYYVNFRNRYGGSTTEVELTTER